MIQVFKGGVWRQLVGAKVFRSGAWRSILQVKVFASGAWRTVANFSPPGGGGGGGGTLVVNTAPSSAGRISSSQVITSVTITATPSGGTAPYTYAWSFFGDPGVCHINSPTTASTTVTAAPVDPGFTEGCQIRCTATDSLGATGTSNTADLSFTNTSGGGGGVIP